MKAEKLLLLSLAVASIAAVAAEWTFSYRPASVRYAVYGNSLGDPLPPTQADAKVAFEVTGRAAREIFDAIGPDKEDACSSEGGTRFRSRDEDRLACTRTKTGDYSCYFGFDLKTGKSSGGSIC